jgi:hypothetical protein
MTDNRDVSPDWDNDVWREEDCADFLGCDVEELEDTIENQMD